jgi:hypothetical protein
VETTSSTGESLGLGEVEGEFGVELDGPSGDTSKGLGEATGVPGAGVELRDDVGVSNGEGVELRAPDDDDEPLLPCGLPCFSEITASGTITATEVTDTATLMTKTFIVAVAARNQVSIISPKKV